MNNELYLFVKESLQQGIPRDAIQDALLQARWQPEEVSAALASFAELDFPVPVPRPKPYLQARDAFFYVVSFIALYVSAFSFGTLIFSFIERAFPDPPFYGGFVSGSFARAIAALIVTFPLYLFFMWRISVANARDPERRQSLIRKWLTYLTLVVASGIIIGDLIFTLTNFLEGDLTIRFLLKAATILVITGVIFGYYLWDLQREEKVQQ
jgi:hypothetical protein